MLNLLEALGFFISLLMCYISFKQKDSRFIIFGALFFPIAVIWEALSIGKEWIYAAPPGQEYSVFVLSGVPLAIPLGWSLSIMAFAWIADRIKNDSKSGNIWLIFLIGVAWGLAFELFFVSKGYWVYLRQPQIAGIRPSVPLGWGALALMSSSLYSLFSTQFGESQKKYRVLFNAFLLNFLGSAIWIVSLKLASILAIDPLYAFLSGL